MRLLVVDGNSIVNRAFYGIKLLTTKDGRYTNAIYGFLNIFLKLKEQCEPDHVAFAFDLHAPTFRHKMYAEYKAGRKPMPDELREQIPVLKELLITLGYKVVEHEGWEADDILGTLSALCKGDDKCFLATGDRDSLQLINENVNVLLTSTKMGRTQTVNYDVAEVEKVYGVTPSGLIQIKALQGDSSDNIPGVSGVGPKTAGDLIIKYKSVDNIYKNIDSLDIKPNLKEKLVKDKASAFLSLELGTIKKDAPVSLNTDDYIPSGEDKGKASRILASLEMFKIAERLGLNTSDINIDESQIKENNIHVQVKPSLNDIEIYETMFFVSEYKENEIIRTAFWQKDGIAVCENNGLNFSSDFADFLCNSDCKLVTSDVKALYKWCLSRNIDVPSDIGDVALAGYILNPSAKDYSASRILLEYCNKSINCDIDDLLCKDTASLPEAWNTVIGAIEKNNQSELLNKIELPLAQVLASMENVGFLVDAKGIQNFGIKLKEEIDRLTDDIYSLAGFEFNINSPKQLGEALFEKLQIKGGKKTKTGYSTSADVLEGLAYDNPIIKSVLEYRTLAKLKSTYCDGLLKVISPDGRIHSTLNQTETRTGRISSSEPNLQNIPVRSELGKEMRKFFVAADGCTLVDADYSQIELRVLAHIANDKNMIETFNNDEDIHAITASQVFNMPLQMVTPLMRSRAKAVNFGIVYGIGAFSLAKDIGVSRQDADKYIKGYLHHFSGVNRYMEATVEKAKQDGYVSTLFERRRGLPELTASNAMLRKFGERVARNMPIQGTAADIIKIAMIKVYNRLKEEKLKSKLIMQVHDELIVEAFEDEADRVAVIVNEEMENACKMNVRLKADVHTGKTWYSAKG